MSPPLPSRRTWVIRIAAIIAAGILSRLVPTGFVLFDKPKSGS